MQVSSAVPIDPYNLEYENTPLKLVSNRRIQRTETPGYTIENIEERREFSAPFWIAKLLVETGFAHIEDDGVSPDEWTQIHFKERFNPGGPPVALPKDFFARAYISLLQSAKEVEKDPSKNEQFNRLQARFRDILESRIGKITRLASAESSPQQGVFQPEELRLYDELQNTISTWRANMRRMTSK
jgi:hypothetical protein